jgi:hypothetical protein
MTSSIRALVAGQGVHNFAAHIAEYLQKAESLPKLKTRTEKGKSRELVITSLSQIK